MVRVFSLFLVFACAIGCAKDQTADEFAAAQAERDMAKLRSVQGRYSGIVIADANEKPLGALEVVLVASLKSGAMASGGSGSGGASRKAYLDVGMDFKDSRLVHIGGQDSFFNYDSGLFQVNFVVRRDDGSEETVALTAYIDNGTMRGTLAGVGFGGRQGKFSLDLNGASLDELSKPFKDVTDPDEGLVAIFKAQQKLYPDDPPGGRTLTLTTTYPELRAVDHFMKIFLPETQRSLEVDLKYWEGNPSYPTGYHQYFPSVLWDNDSGNLETPPNSGADTTPHLRCTGFYLDKTKDPFVCYWWSNVMPRVTLTFKPVKK